MPDGAGPVKIDAQFPAILAPLFRPRRYKVLHGGRGSAKSWSVARALLILASARPLRVLCAREIQKTIKDSVHRLLKDQIAALGLPGFTVLDNEIRHTNGGLFSFTGLAEQTAESIKSYEGYDVCWVEEAQSVSKSSWDVLTPTIRKPESEIWMTLNPKLVTDETYSRFVAAPPADAWVQAVNWRDNPWFPAVLDAERLGTKARDPDNYDNIWEGVAVRVAEGAIYGAEVAAMYAAGRVRPCPHDPILVVDTVWDLGWNDSMTIGMFQRAASEVRLIDYIEDSHKTLDWYVRELERRPYRYGTDFIPHDGKARNIQTGKSTEEVLQGMRRTVDVLEAVSIEEGIRAVRLMLPRLFIDLGSATDQDKKKTGTPRLLECMSRYRRVLHSKTGEPMGPLHDEYSHGADMIRYAGQAVERMGRVLKSSRPRDNSNYDWRTG